MIIIHQDLSKLKLRKEKKMKNKYLYKVERERVVTDWWYVEANDEKEAKTKAFVSEIDDSDYGNDIKVIAERLEEI